MTPEILTSLDAHVFLMASSQLGDKQMIKKGQQVWIKPEWQDAGDDQFTWVAAEDEDGGRVLITAHIGMAINPSYRIETEKLNSTDTPGC